MNLLNALHDLVMLLLMVNKTQKDSLLTQHLGDWFPGWPLNIHSHFLHFQRFISFQLAKGGKPKHSLDKRTHPHQTQTVWYFDSCSLRKQNLGLLGDSLTKHPLHSNFSFCLEIHRSFRFKTIYRFYASEPAYLQQICISRPHLPFLDESILVHSLCSISTVFC